MKKEDMLFGVVNCLRLHVYAEPKEESEIICKLRFLTEVIVDLGNSTEEFYKIYTAIGAEGFCRKELLIIK